MPNQSPDVPGGSHGIAVFKDGKRTAAVGRRRGHHHRFNGRLVDVQRQKVSAGPALEAGSFFQGAFRGNVTSVGLPVGWYAPAASIHRTRCRNLEALASGGCAFNTIRNIQADVPLENIVAMIEASREVSP